MKQRIITAIFFGAAMIGGVYGGKLSFVLLFGVVTAGCAWELMGLLMSGGERFRPLRQGIGVLLGLCFYIQAAGEMLGYWNIMQSGSFALFSMMSFCVLIILELFLAGKKPFDHMGYYLLVLVYISLPFTLLAALSTANAGWAPFSAASPYLPNRVFGLLLLVWTNDTFAYFTGSRLGKTKLFERISPKKTWEGTIGGGIGAVLMAWGLSFVFPDFSTPQWLALGVVAAVFGTLGDLVESMLKRSVGVKDSGSLLPGHGGLLDRFDAFIFMIPFAWLVLMIFWS